MDPVGFLGIIKLTTQIILKNYKHFLCIAMLWVIPFAFHVPVLDVSSFAVDSLVGSSFSLYKLIISKEEYLPSPAAMAPASNAPFPGLDLPPLSPIIARLFFSVTIPLISYPLLTFSVYRACLNKSLSLKGSFLGVPRSAKNLARTSVLIGVVVSGFIAMTLGMAGIIAGVVGAVMGAERATGAVRMSMVIMFCTFIAMGIGGVYLAITFSLAPTVAILEEKRGWGAMRRSMDLVNGRKWVALGLVCVCYGMYELCGFGVLWRWTGARIVRVSLQALMALFGMAAHVGLYVSCKNQREEALNTLIAASPQFGPQDSSPKSMDVETAAFLSE